MKKSTIIIAMGIGLGLAISAGAGNYKSYNQKSSRNSKNYSKHSSYSSKKHYTSQTYSSKKQYKHYSYRSKQYYHQPTRKVVVYQPVVRYRKPEVVVVYSSRTYRYNYPKCTNSTYRRYERSDNKYQAAKIINSSLLLLGSILNCVN
jgi:hypothetical protein